MARKRSPGVRPLRVFTANIWNFDGPYEARQKLMRAEIRRLDPDLLAFQEAGFDGKRDQAHPVDGGVFDVVDCEVVVPIRAAIRVFEPKLFAVTVERPGGVVVSKRERIVLTAAL